MSIPISQFIPPPPLPPGSHRFVFYICDSPSVLCISIFFIAPILSMFSYMDYKYVFNICAIVSYFKY